MEEILYEKSLKFAGYKVEVFPNRIVYSNGIAYMKKETTILINQISSIDTKLGNEVFIKTNDGKEIKIPTFSQKEREDLKNAILSLI